MDTPIGIMDSGVGGLTVWQEITKLIPQASTIYLADSKNAPYGEKTSEAVIKLAIQMVEFLKCQGVTTIVVACNTITVSALSELRTQFPQVNFIGTVPAIKTAAEKSKNKRIGILTTKRTEESNYLSQLIEQFASECEVIVAGTNKLVPLIEQGDTKSDRLKTILRQILRPMKNIDSLVLGCTHYPFLSNQISEILPNVSLIDSGEAVARQVRRVIVKNREHSKSEMGNHVFYTTGDLVTFNEALGRLGIGQSWKVEKC